MYAGFDANDMPTASKYVYTHTLSTNSSHYHSRYNHYIDTIETASIASTINPVTQEQLASYMHRCTIL